MRVVPIAAKLVAAAVALLVLSSLVVIQGLSTREYNQLVASKRAAAVRIAELFVAYDAVSLAFGDQAGIEEDVKTLASTPDLTYAAVWQKDSSKASAQVGAAPARMRRPQIRDAIVQAPQHIDVLRRIRGTEGEVLGVALVRMSLAPENAAYLAARARIALFTALLAAAIAIMLAVIVHITVARPLKTLTGAAVRLEQGERVTVSLGANDEVGVLSRAFNTMTAAIVDREDELRATTYRLQGVLDHMGQAIVVFGADGKIEAERSAQAVELVGAAAGCPAIVDVLFPAESATLMERSAFEAWLEAALGASRATWDELSDLAPSEALIERGGQRRLYELAFKPLVEGERVTRVMLLASDVTEQRALLQRVTQQDEEHARRLAAMRRLIAGGGQVFVRFLEAARFRLDACVELLRRLSPSEREAAEELFRHVHTLRGEARCFDLDGVERELSEIEFALADLRTRHDERYDVAEIGRDLLARFERVAQGLDTARALFVSESPVGDAILDQVTVRRSQLAQLAQLTTGSGPALTRLVDSLTARPFGEIVFFVSESVPRWLAREGKSAVVSIEGRDAPVPGPLAAVLAGVLAHLLRNAIAHGIETPPDRATHGKPAEGHIQLACRTDARGTIVVVQDDGAGFDLDGLVARASAMGVAGSSDATSLAFEHGVSTRQQPSSVAGHGVGLGAVRSELNAVGYDVRVASTKGQGTVIELVPKALLQGAA